jgi:hypothetical protein
MEIQPIASRPGRLLTHVELLHRPGERVMAARLLALLGCEPVDRDGHWFTSFVDPDAPRDWATNVLYASEVGPEQWALEQALPMEAEAYRAAMRREPQKSAHFGIRVPTEAALEELLERVASAGRDDPGLAGRVAVDGVFRPGEPGAIAPDMVQAFVWTDVVAAGLLSLGQHIEVQWHRSVQAT